MFLLMLILQKNIYILYNDCITMFNDLKYDDEQ